MTRSLIAAVSVLTVLSLSLILPAEQARAKAPKSDAQPATRPANPQSAIRNPQSEATQPATPVPDDVPCPASRPAGSTDVPVFAANSPFGTTRPAAEAKREKVLWAKSCLYEKAPDFVVEKWLTDKPQTKGKYVLIEFWATWCPPCRRSINLLNEFHRTYGKDMVIIGISDETEEAVRKLKEPKIEYYSAIDTQGRMKKALEVRGIPHVIILEPEEGCVIWEGFPLLKGYELTENIIKKIVAIKPEKKSE